MRKSVAYTLVAVIVLLAGATAVFVQKYSKRTAEYNDMKTAEESARTQYADAFSAIAEIQDSLNAIAVGDTSLPMVSSGLAAEQRMTQPNKRQALDRIALLSASVQRAKAKINQLESTVKRSGIRMAGMEKLIASLKLNVSGKEEQIAQLTGRVDSLQTQVTTLATTVQADADTMRAQSQTIEERRRELATIEYVIGTKKDLENSGLIMARGGVLGMGKTLKLSGRFDDSRFTPLDTDFETVVRTPAAKVEVLSPQPTSSYALEVVGGQVEVHILNPTEFRKVKHLVIMTKERAKA